MTKRSYMLRGQAAINIRDFSDAVHWFNLAVQSNSKDAQALACLGQAHCWEGQQLNGLKLLRRSGRLLQKQANKTKDVTQLLLLAEQLQFWNDYHSAKEFLKSAEKIHSGSARVYQLLALTYSRINQEQTAVQMGKKALRFAPDNAVLNILLATLESSVGENDKAIRRLEKVLSFALSHEESYRAHKELAIILDKKGRYDQVFKHLREAEVYSIKVPSIKKQNAQLIPEMIRDNQSGFSAALLQQCVQLLSEEKDVPDPVFLMGFFRSGTTLTQKILGAHSSVFVADESDLVVAMNNELKRISGNSFSQPKQLESLNANTQKYLRDYYWSRAKGKYGSEIIGKLFVDKTTMNTLDVGLINCIFPNAKIIFMIRDPRDICLSAYMQVMKPSPTTIHLLNWHSLAEFYVLVMDWWFKIKQILTVEVIEVKYEDAVSHFESTFQRVFCFLDLQWEPGVENFHQYAASRAIISPSYHQVVKPLYQTSVGRWQLYESEFDTISKTLDPSYQFV